MTQAATTPTDGVLNRMDLTPFAARLADPSLCTRCGECCHFGVDLGGEAIATLHDLPCEHLLQEDDDSGDDAEGGNYLCRVYPHRLDPDGPAPWCRSTTGCVEEGLFPSTCPYVEGIPGYRGRITFKPRDERKLLSPVLAGERPQGVDPLAWELAKSRETKTRDAVLSKERRQQVQALLSP